jgi:hypothetical protein
MFKFQHIRLLAAVLVIAAMTGCATQKPADYTAFKESRPRSIVVLPPLNNTPSVTASYSVLSYATIPLAEAGYYVVPVTLMDEAFRENGLTQPAEMHSAPAEKLRQIFGADAALYITITEYGTSFKVLSSASVVAANAKLVDLKTGKVLWTQSASASSEEGRNQQQQGGLLGLLITAVVQQVIESSADTSHKVAATTTARLLAPGAPQGLLHGPRSPNYGKD